MSLSLHPNPFPRSTLFISSLSAFSVAAPCVVFPFFSSSSSIASHNPTSSLFVTSKPSTTTFAFFGANLARYTNDVLVIAPLTKTYASRLTTSPAPVKTFMML